MIQKVKDLMNVKAEIDVIKNNIKYATSAVSELKGELADFKDAMREHEELFESKTGEFGKTLQDTTEKMKGLQHDLEKELFQFKLLKSQMQKKILEKFEEELDKELVVQLDNLKNDAATYQEMKAEIDEIVKKVNILGQEIDKFTNISQQIQKGDFELKTFAKQLLEMDQEKLELMRKIDTLERLVSKMRRQQIVTR